MSITLREGYTGFEAMKEAIAKAEEPSPYVITYAEIIAITPEMIEAGLDVLIGEIGDDRYTGDDARIVARIFSKMYEKLPCCG